MLKRPRTAAVGLATMVALALASCGGGGGSGPGSSQNSTTLRLALNQTETHPSFIALDAWGKSLSEATGGRWTIQVFPNSTLGDQAEYLQSVSTGVIDLAIVSAPQLENLQKDFVIFSLPTVFDSIEHQMKVLDDKSIVGDVYSSLEQSNNITVVGGVTQGARSVYTKDGPAENPAALTGKKIRVQESPVFLSMVKALGGSPTPMAFGEVYTALQSGVIDGAENNEISYATQKHYEVSKFYSYSRHLIGADFLISNTGALSKMSAEDRAAFDQTWDGAWQQHTELWTTDTEKAVADAKAGGATFTEVDSAAYAAALEPLLDEFITQDSQQQLYDGIRKAAE